MFKGDPMAARIHANGQKAVMEKATLSPPGRS
jgi:hypothetical protein